MNYNELYESKKVFIRRHSVGKPAECLFYIRLVNSFLLTTNR